MRDNGEIPVVWELEEGQQSHQHAIMKADEDADSHQE
jgi:hypothetical protein